MNGACTRTLLILAIGFTLAVVPADAARIVIVNGDSPGEGFNDPSTPTAEMGCPPGTTLGECRLRAFTAAANRWGSMLESDVAIRISASFNPLQCDVTATVLGTCGATSLHQDFPGAPFAGTWYPSALADALAGIDQNPGGLDMAAQFNSNLDSDPACTANWWYGTDGAFPGNFAIGADLSARHFFAVALHQLAHGLGFDTYVDLSTGALAGGFPDIYSRLTYDATVGLHWHEMTNAQRAISAVNSGQVVLDGPRTKIAADNFLTGQNVDVVVITGAASGTYTGTGGLFGASWAITDGFTELMEEVDDGSGVSPTDACEPLVGFTPGRIAFVDRGTCQFGFKALHAEQAGASGVVIADNGTGLIVMAPGEVGRQVTIPVVMIGQADADLIRPTLPAAALYNVIDVFGLHTTGFPLIYAPNPLDGRLSITHFDVIAGPNALLEPEVAVDVYDDPDMALALLRDAGWKLSRTLGESHAIDGFTGGGQFNAYYGGSTGDVVGFRFSVEVPIEVDRLGVWNVDTAAGAIGLSSPHQVGIWDSSQTLVASATVDPASGTPIGDWTYASITPVTLNPGEVYTAGALYTTTDNDSFVSSATSLSTDPNVRWLVSVFPSAGSLGFTYPTGSSMSSGRFGPNFTFVDPAFIFADGFEAGATSAWSFATP